MLNKIYDKTRRFIKENYKSIIFFLIFALIFNIKFDYEIYSAGGLIDISKRVEVEDSKKDEGSFNLSFVTGRKGILPFVLLSYIIPGWDLVPLDESRVEDESYEEILERNKIYLKEGVNNAIISAFNEAGEEFKIKSSHLTVIYVMSDAETEIKVGDELIDVNGNKVNNLEEFSNQINLYSNDDNITITVKRNNKMVKTTSKIKTIEEEKVVGLFLVNLFEIKTSKDIEINYKTHEGGSSGGFMTSLYIYNALTDEKLAGNNKIAGTGTIDSEGYVGEIAGIKYKLLGSEKNKADVFLVPYDNYEEAKKVKEEFSLKIKLIKVNTLREAINKLKGYNMTK